MKKIFTLIAAAFVALAANAETKTVWEGTLDAPEWGNHSDVANAKVKELVADGTIKMGTVFTVYGTRTATDYCSIALVNDWWQSVIDGTEGEGRTVLTFEGTAATSASFTVAEVTLTAINNAGFFINGHGFTLTKIEISNEEKPQPEGNVLWKGSHYVSWELEDGNPNKEWKELSQDQFASFAIGDKVVFTFQIVETDTYHQYKMDDWGWNLMPGQVQTDLTAAETKVELEITQEVKDAVKNNGFAIHGHGFKVTKAELVSKTTAISTLSALSSQLSATYNLAGQRASKGLVIENGKKVVK